MTMSLVISKIRAKSRSRPRVLGSDLDVDNMDKRRLILMLSPSVMLLSRSMFASWREAKSDSPSTPHETDLYIEVKKTQWPIIYGPEYNIGFLGLEKLHPFDAGKWGRVYGFLKQEGMIRDDTTIRPLEAKEKDLMVVHTKSYISSLRWSMTVAGITEVPPVALLPNFIVQRKVLKPFRYQTGGTILAAKLAVERGWSINIGGGFHHCSSDRGGGFCAYADLTLAIKFLFMYNPNIKSAMIVDLDAHQGNGHERDFMEDGQVYIMDVYNRNIYPHDGYAKRAIRRKVELSSFTEDEQYLGLVKENLKASLEEFTPDIIVYNAGTDILEGDPLGRLSITDKGIIARDEIVFSEAKARKIPVFMVTSGGYQRSTARIIADSILNLKTKGLIECKEAAECPEPELVVLPRSQSDMGLFARIKSACLSNQSTQDLRTAAATDKATHEDKPLSRSIPDFQMETDLMEACSLKEGGSSKSCSDLCYSFKDESDVDMASLLDVRFGGAGGNDPRMNASMHNQLLDSECDISMRGDGNVSMRGDGNVSMRGDGNVSMRGDGDISMRGDGDGEKAAGSQNEAELAKT